MEEITNLERFLFATLALLVSGCIFETSDVKKDVINSGCNGVIVKWQGTEKDAATRTCMTLGYLDILGETCTHEMRGNFHDLD